jgi:hypothetical protein
MYTATSLKKTNKGIPGEQTKWTKRGRERNELKERDRKNPYSKTSRLENLEELKLHHYNEKSCCFDCAVALCTIQNALLVISDLTWLDLSDELGIERQKKELIAFIAKRNPTERNTHSKKKKTRLRKWMSFNGRSVGRREKAGKQEY